LRLWRANWRYALGIASVLSGVLLFSIVSQALLLRVAYDSPLPPVPLVTGLVIAVFLFTLGWRWCYLPLRPSLPELLRVYSGFFGLMVTASSVRRLRETPPGTTELLVMAAAVGLICIGLGLFAPKMRDMRTQRGKNPIETANADDPGT